jgi:hypothetical protein
VFATAESGLGKQFSAGAKRIPVLVVQHQEKNMANAVILPGERLAGLQVDMLQKLRSGKRTLDELTTFLQGKNPFALECNKHGHITIIVTGTNLTGAQEVERLIGAKYDVGDRPKSCLISMGTDSYDVKHRLVDGQVYEIAIVPLNEIAKRIARQADRTTDNILKYYGATLGYQKPLAGIVPRIREAISDKQMRDRGIGLITAPHDPIKDSDDFLNTLSSYRMCDNNNGAISACSGEPNRRWSNLDDADAALAFLVPTS